MTHHILVVDDQQDVVTTLEMLLVEAGYTTGTAVDGEAALTQIQTTPPDLVVLDVNMPGIDGFALATMLKSDPATATIPIIMLSGQDGRGSKLIGLESGAEDYLGKPVDPAELLARIRNLLLLRDRTLHGARQ